MTRNVGKRFNTSRSPFRVMYIVAILVGTVVTAGALYLLKKPLIEMTPLRAVAPASK